LAAFVSRPPIEPWAGSGLPWNEPGFSARMLREHLSQAHDRASRRFETIDRHVAWLHREVLGGRKTFVLDLGCGPGLYWARLARMGHECTGIDFSPASVAYAREQAGREGLACSYQLQDLRGGGYGDEFGLGLLISGELNVFEPQDASTILAATRESLAVGAALVLEAHTEAHVRAIGERPPRWSALPRGLFSDQPHLLLQENAWFSDAAAAVERFWVVDAATSRVEDHAITTRAYSEAGYDAMLRSGGFSEVRRVASLEGVAPSAQDGLCVFIARR